MQGSQLRQTRPTAPQAAIRAAPVTSRAITGQQPVAGQRMAAVGGAQMPRPAGGMQAPQAARPSFKYTATMRNPPQPSVQVAQQASQVCSVSS